jgi:hypothetical protein
LSPVHLGLKTGSWFAMRDRLLVGLAVALLLSALVTAFPVLPRGHHAPSATAAAVEPDAHVSISLPVGAFGGMALGLILMAGLVVAQHRGPQRSRARTVPTP